MRNGGRFIPMAPNEDRDSIIEDEILAKFLDNAAAKAMRNIEEQGSLSTEDAIPLMLKSQFNHIAHLDKQMVTKAEFLELKEGVKDMKEQMVTKVEFKGLENKFQGLENKFQGLENKFQGLENKFQGFKDHFQVLKDQFQGLKDQFSFLKWVIGIGFVMLFALNLYIVFFK